MSYDDNKEYLEELGYIYQEHPRDIFLNKQTRLAFAYETINNANHDNVWIDKKIKKNFKDAANLTGGKYICICNDEDKIIEL